MQISSLVKLKSPGSVCVFPLTFVNVSWALPTEPVEPWVHAGPQQ